jgi:hypothetical protein
MVLALPAEQSGEEVARFLPKLERVPNAEELLRLIENVDSPAAKTALQQILAKPDARRVALDAFLKVRNRIEPSKITALLGGPLKTMWDALNEDRAFVARVVGAFRVEALSGQLNDALKSPNTAPAVQAACLRALREMNSGDPATFAALIKDSKDRTVRDEALNSLAASKSGTATILEFWPEMNSVQHRTALRQFTQDEARATALVKAAQTGTVHERELDAESLEKIRQLLPKNAEAKASLNAFPPPSSRCSGWMVAKIRMSIRTLRSKDRSQSKPGFVSTKGIGNSDGILGIPGGPDFNFFNSTFRVYGGHEFGDRAVARRPMTPNTWTHVAVTRDSQGMFCVYINGEIDATDNRAMTNTFNDLDIGRPSANGGTAGDLTELRVWNRTRSADEIRADFDRTFAGESLPSGLVHYFPGAGPWGTLKGGAQVEKVADSPSLLSPEQARALGAKFNKYRALANEDGDSKKEKRCSVPSAPCATASADRAADRSPSERRGRERSSKHCFVPCSHRTPRWKRAIALSASNSKTAIRWKGSSSRKKKTQFYSASPISRTSASPETKFAKPALRKKASCLKAC